MSDKTIIPCQGIGLIIERLHRATWMSKRAVFSEIRGSYITYFLNGINTSMSSNDWALGNSVNTNFKYRYGLMWLALAVSIRPYKFALALAPATLSANRKFLRLCSYEHNRNYDHISIM